MGLYATSHNLVDAELKEFINQLNVEQANAALEVYHRTVMRLNAKEEALTSKPWTAERSIAIEEIRKESLQVRQEADYLAAHYYYLLKKQG